MRQIDHVAIPLALTGGPPLPCKEPALADIQKPALIVLTGNSAFTASMSVRISSTSQGLDPAKKADTAHFETENVTLLAE